METNLAKIKKPANAKQLAVLIAKICDSKLAEDILLIDLTKVESAPADFFVLCSCDSQPQVAAICDEIYSQARELDIDKPRAEGLEEKEWALIDFFDVVAHVMLRKTREYYKIERLWGDGTFHVLTEAGKTHKLTQKEIMEMVMTKTGDD